MLNEIIKKYGEFPDSWIKNINYFVNDNSRIIEITIVCANNQNENKYEIIILCFLDIIEFRFLELHSPDNFATGDVFIKQIEDIITFDFCPIDHFDYLEENPNSNFKIKCKKMDYKYISKYDKTDSDMSS